MSQVCRILMAVPVLHLQLAAASMGLGSRTAGGATEPVIEFLVAGLLLFGLGWRWQRWINEVERRITTAPVAGTQEEPGSEATGAVIPGRKPLRRKQLAELQEIWPKVGAGS